MDLSFPKSDAINDYINPDDCAIKFDSFDRAVEMVAKLRKGALMGKLDIKSVYRICPVCKEDLDLLGIMWEGCIFIDLRQSKEGSKPQIMHKDTCNYKAYNHKLYLYTQLEHL